MFVFVCAGCGAELTAPLSQVALPVHARQQFGNGLQLPVLMEPGTFAVDPEPWGPPWRRWEDVGPDEAASRGVYAPVHALSDAAPGAVAIAPGDARNTRLVAETPDPVACCGLAGGGGPNMACEACGRPVASRIDDCSLWQAVWLAPEAVRRLPVGGVVAAPLSWAEVMAEAKGTPPFEPFARWGTRELLPFWLWSPRWEAAAGGALAHLLVASEGRPVTVPGGLAQEVFQRSLDALLPAGPSARHAVLAGPGVPAPGEGADILLVPSHPQTGESWAPDDLAREAREADGAREARGAADSPYLVPLPVGVWQWLAFPERQLTVPASGGIPDGVLRDEPPTPRAHHLFRADEAVFQHTLVRLPAVRRPWLREVLAGLRQRRYGSIF